MNQNIHISHDHQNFMEEHQNQILQLKFYL